MRQYEVIIPVRNGGQPLVNSIQSVLSCANSGELLLTLSDNFSTDGTPWKKVLEDYPKDSWRIISPPQSLGRVEHWTWAFAEARLPWVKPLMVGDMIENSFWTWVNQAIAAHPDAGLFFSGDHTIDPGKAHPDVKSELSAEQATSLYSYDDFMRDAVNCRNRIGALSRALMRADITRQALPFEPEYPWTADWRFCKRFLQRAPAVQTPAPLVSLDRSIPRVSTSWKGIRGSFREEWIFAAEQAASSRAPSTRAFSQRVRAVGSKVILVLGRRVVPRPIRRILTTVTGIHRNPQAQKT